MPYAKGRRFFDAVALFFAVSTILAGASYCSSVSEKIVAKVTNSDTQIEQQQEQSLVLEQSSAEFKLRKRSLLQPIDFQRAFGRFCLTIVDFKGLQAAVARQEGCQVLAFLGGFQFAEKMADVLAWVDFIVFAALDHRVHEGVVHS